MIGISIIWLSILAGALALPYTQPRQENLNPYPNKPRLVFKPDGTFKVTVFSDLHFGENPWDWWGPEHDASSIKLMQTVLADEKPDYAVLNGDLITGENTFRENSTTIIDIIVGPFNDAKVPFSSTHGNHDNQPNITHLEEIQREQLVAPLSYTRAAPNGVGGTGGPGNYWVPVYRNSNDESPAVILWFFDSRGGFSAGQNPVGVPDWVDATVGDWIKSETQAMEAAWGPSEKRGALAFVHIPPHPVQALQAKITSEKNPGLNADILGVGSIQASGDLSNGKNDRPFWDSLNSNVKNLHAVISGHDHGNEWCAREPEKDVIFCFDKHAGYGGYTQSSWGYGVRNLVFKSPDPTVPLETWLRLEGGETHARITLDDTYGR
ncbi:Metallo-dependent phosphatase [Panaeolus papilionaceus]|nr:Metallo-dependent phosphatase [Panaeolus papilionaceus]